MYNLKLMRKPQTNPNRGTLDEITGLYASEMPRAWKVYETPQINAMGYLD